MELNVTLCGIDDDDEDDDTDDARGGSKYGNTFLILARQSSSVKNRITAVGYNEAVCCVQFCSARSSSSWVGRLLLLFSLTFVSVK
jgi:hypothetical protein